MGVTALRLRRVLTCSGRARRDERAVGSSSLGRAVGSPLLFIVIVTCPPPQFVRVVGFVNGKYFCRNRLYMVLTESRNKDTKDEKRSNLDFFREKVDESTKTERGSRKILVL